MATPWTNWARTASCVPRHRFAPSDVDEVVRLVRWAGSRGLTLRVVGAGHSFTGAAATDGVMITLDHLSGLHSIDWYDDGRADVTVGAGTRLFDLNRLLDAQGLALANLGDIDRQSIAGAISTSTHGTGARLTGLAALISGVELVAGDGSVWWADAERHPELFAAARVSLGALGILTAVRVHAVPAYRLHARSEPAELPEVLERLDELTAAHRHLEFFWFPHTTHVQLKSADLADATSSGVGQSAWRRAVDEEVMENLAFGLVNRLGAAAPDAIPALNEVSGRVLSTRDYTDTSYRVFATSRRVRFAESEWAIARRDLPGLLDEIAVWLRTSGERVSFPIEVRFAAGDDAWLSTAYGGARAYVAVHTYHRAEHDQYFRAVAAMARAVGGRPHWGKLHPLTAADLAPLYPHFTDFLTVRDRLDPTRIFANPYTERVLGS